MAFEEPHSETGRIHLALHITIATAHVTDPVYDIDTCVCVHRGDVG